MRLVTLTIFTTLLTSMCVAQTATQTHKSVTIKSADGIPITGDLYLAHDASAPFILLCHQAGWSRGEYREIAERRVRLGLVLAEIGRKADVQITEQEVQQAMISEARRYPGQEREVIEFFQQNPGAMAQIRAPIYEDKVVDYILEQATVEEKKVSKEELFKDDDED